MAMLEQGAMPPMAEAVDAARDYLRLDESGDDALVAGLVTAAVERCEAVVGEVLIARAMREVLPAQAAWRWLAAGPVRQVTEVRALAQDGAESALAAGDYEIDLDSEARARVRLRLLPPTTRIVVRYAAGRSDGWGALPIGLRHGVLRLVAHWYAYREAGDVPAMPAAVMALWAPMRRMRLG
jgi:uncharacterized phiE125 gp8 family phage protein